MSTSTHLHEETILGVKYVTFNQAQEILSCSRGTLYNLITEKTLNKYKIRSGSRLKLAEIYAYMEDQHVAK